MKNKWFLTIFLLVLLGSFIYLFATQRFNLFGNANVNRNANTNISNTNTTPFPPVDADTAIKKFRSYEEFQDFIETKIASVSTYGWAKSLAMRAPVAADIEEFAGLEAIADGRGGGRDFSTTNIQVTGVDEADIVKSDGTYVYVASGNKVYIIEVYPAESAKITATLEFRSPPQNLYINGSSLVVYGSEVKRYYPMTGVEPRDIDIAPEIMPIPDTGQVFFKVFDVSDKTAPREVRDLKFEGYAGQSRMIGNYVYLITMKQEYDVAQEEMPLPRMWGKDKLLTADPSSPSFVMPDLYYFPVPYESVNFTSVSAINVSDPGVPPASQVYMLESNQYLYVSPTNMYIVYTKYVQEEELMFEVLKNSLINRLNEKSRARVQEIEQVPDHILSRYEKYAKITAVFERYIASFPAEEEQALRKELETTMKARYLEVRDELEKTIIHKIAIDNGQLTYKTAGEVPGHVLNQFSMDEYEGYFRIATTRSAQWSRFAEEQDTEPYNNLYILNAELARVGAVEHLAATEQIFAVRFMQGRAYMVTFRRTDPLFVIDVQDPTNPRVLGELKIPGYSTYLHPYDDTLLIGLGRNTYEDESGRVIERGIKISLFDVSDVSSPKETANFIIGNSYESSPALDDHRAFLFSMRKNLLVIPIQGDYFALRSFDTKLVPERISPVTNSLQAAYVFTIARDSIELKGIVDHTVSGISGPETIYWGNSVKRSLYIEDVLYTLSDRYLKLNKLDDVSALTSFELESSQNSIEPIPLIVE